MKKIWAKKAWINGEWQENILLSIHEAGKDCGKIASISPQTPSCNDDILNEGDIERCDILLPAPVNCHSHGFQRAMAGLTERPPAKGDRQNNFWGWRQVMYHFLDNLTPDDIENISAFAQMEMLEAGYASLCEFHYLHHDKGGSQYDNIHEISMRLMGAAEQTGMGITLLPVLYQQANVKNAPLSLQQRRFFCSNDDYDILLSNMISFAEKQTMQDCHIGVAAHSLRAVSLENIQRLNSMYKGRAFHIHIAEQLSEIDEVFHHYNKRPVELLLDSMDVGGNHCLIHATHMNSDETVKLAKTRAVVGLCPITEGNLGDGIFPAQEYMQNDGKIAIGSDSNVFISLTEELRLLEYGQRLFHQKRNILVDEKRNISTGENIYQAILEGGSNAGRRKTGRIEVGYYADLLSLDEQYLYLSDEKYLLDSWIFTCNHPIIKNLWSAGRHVVKESRHIHRDIIQQNYKKTLHSLLHNQ